MSPETAHSKGFTFGSLRNKILFYLTLAFLLFNITLIGSSLIFEKNSLPQSFAMDIAPAIVSFFTTLVIAWVIPREFTGPIAWLTEAAKKAAKGDLTTDNSQRKSASCAEFSQLYTAYDQVISQTRSVVGHITSLSQQLTTIITSYEKNVGHANAAAHNVAATIDQVAKGAQQQSEHLDTANSMIRAMAEDSAALTNDSQQMQTTMDQLKLQIDTSSKHISELGEKSDHIGEIVAAINDLADQTNLLALNAAIEAARAGEHGRGFAVVADEVRKLAERSSESTKEIGTIIRDIQVKTQESVDAMNAIVEGIDVSVNVVKITGEKSQLIKHRTQQTQNAIENVASVSEENSSAADQVSTATQEMAIQITEMTALTQGFSAVAQEINTLARKFHWEYQPKWTEQQKKAQLQTIDTPSQIILSAIQGHIAWKDKIREIMHDRMQADPETIANPTLCVLGQWLYGSANTILSAEKLEALKEQHKEFHQLVSSIVKLHQQHKDHEAEAVLKANGEFQKLSEALINQLLVLQKDVSKQQKAA